MRAPFRDSGDETFCSAVNDRSRRHDAPAGPQRGAVNVANENLVVKIPYHRLPRDRIVKQVIRFAVAVKIRNPTKLQPDHSVGP